VVNSLPETNPTGGILMSPIEITSSPLSVKDMQTRYYNRKNDFRVRRGPAVDDKTRLTDTIPYQRKMSSYTASLVGPPLLLQTRVEKTDICRNKLGTIYQKKLWDDVITGVPCELPYRCDDALLESSTSMMSCSSNATPLSFFGGNPLKIRNKLQFYEFLHSITDAPILVRNGETFETSNFLDAQTTSVTVYA